MLGLYLLLSMIIPIIMITFGLKLRRDTSSRINSVYGYRTTWSSKSLETWQFANRYFGKLWFYIGLLVGFISLAIIVLTYISSDHPDSNYFVMVMYLQLAALLVPIIPTELKLKKKFNKDGTPI